MATILQFPAEKVVPVWGLMGHECDAVHAEAHGLMLEGRVTGIGTQNDRMYLCVFGSRGEPYYIGREEGKAASSP